MKPLLPIILAILFTSAAFGQQKFRVSKSITLYSHLKDTVSLQDIASRSTKTGKMGNNQQQSEASHQHIAPGSIIMLGKKSGDYYEVNYDGTELYMAQTDLIFCDPPEIPQKKSTAPNSISDTNPGLNEYSQIDSRKLRTGGDELYAAGKLLQSSLIVGLCGAAVSSFLIIDSSEPSFGIICGVATGVTTIIMQVVGYRKLMKAGEAIKFGATSAGIGMTINLNE